MPSNQPLFASDRRDSSTHSDERAAAEDTALLGSQRQDEPVRSDRARFWREIGLFTWALVATAAVIVLAVYSQHEAAQKDGKKGTPTGKRNLIFMVTSHTIRNILGLGLTDIPGFGWHGPCESIYGP